MGQNHIEFPKARLESKISSGPGPQLICVASSKAAPSWPAGKASLELLIAEQATSADCQRAFHRELTIYGILLS